MVNDNRCTHCRTFLENYPESNVNGELNVLNVRFETTQRDNLPNALQSQVRWFPTFMYLSDEQLSAAHDNDASEVAIFNRDSQTQNYRREFETNPEGLKSWLQQVM